jgi:hypothetical protein
MISKFALAFVIALAGCASPSALPLGLQVTTTDFASEQEASAYLGHQQKYFQLTFEQSHDPYYGTPRWSEDCLRDNQIGSIEKKGGHELIVSQFYYRGAIGFCKQDVQVSLLRYVLVKCQGKAQVKLILCGVDVCKANESWESVCQ